MIPIAIIEVIELCLILILCAQNAYAFVILLLGQVQIKYYEWGIFENPENSLQKSVNFFLRFFVGVGPYIYKKTANHSWFVSKLLYLLYFLLFGIVSIIFFNIFSHLIRLLSY